MPDLAGFDGLVFTSANGVRAFIDLVLPARVGAAFPALPVFTVGRATARAASGAGFATVRSADGDVAALAALIHRTAKGARLLHPGALHPAGDLKGALDGVAEIHVLAVYEAVASDIAAPEVFDLVLIHSPRAARELAARLPAGQAGGRPAVTLSPACAGPLAGLGFASVHVAETPDEAGLFTALTAALGKPPAAV